MQALAERVLKKTRKTWGRTRPVFEPFAPVGAVEIKRVEEKVGALPKDVEAWLLLLGYGDVDQTLSFRYDWFHTIEEGHFRGAVIFAQDDLGNFFAYSPSVGSVHFLARSSPAYATVAQSFGAFMDELERRDFNLGEWMNSLTLLPYERYA